MKLIAVLTFLCVAYVAAEEEWTWTTYVIKHLTVYGIKEEKIVDFSQECQKETEVDTSLFARMNVRDFPEDQPLKCFWACLADKLQVIMKNKDPEYLNPAALADELDPVQLDVATRCLGHYMKPEFGDQCDQVYESHKCYMWSMDKERGCEAKATTTAA